MEPLELPELPEPVPEIEELGILANRSSRFAAWVVDVLIFLGPSVAFYFTYFPLAIVYVVGLALVQVALLTIAGQTLGKKTLDIRIVKMQTGTNGGFVTNVLLRTLLNSLIQAGLNFLTAFVPVYTVLDVLFIFRADRRCIHDLIAGTVVVKVRPSQ
jgi:uncharacterized RDD family membrane protein YckC